jgi:hypothetical protein
MLRLVHPAREGQEAPAPRRKGRPSPSFSLNDAEVRHLRAAIVNVARAYGSIGCLAAALGCNAGVLTRKRRPGPGLALAVARAAGMTVEAVLGGTLNPAGRCPSCGSRVGDRPALRAAGGAR